jgi:hypothetical protein
MDTTTEPKLDWIVVDDPEAVSADSAQPEPVFLSPPHSLVDEEWDEALETIPVDLDRTAKETRALLRRREIKQAVDLLRLVLAYCVCDWPLRLVGLWANLQGLGNMSDVAVMKRIQKCKQWVETLVGVMLQARRLKLKAAHPVRVRIVDGSSISVPGSKGTDYRLHLSLDLGSQRIDGIEVTDVHGGETLARHPSQPDDIWLADRGYARRPDIGATLKAERKIVMRFGWSTFPLEHAHGTPFDLFAWLGQIPAMEPDERTVAVTTPEGRFSLRLIAQRLPQEAAEKNRRRIRQRASKKGSTPDKRTLEAAGYIFLVTNLSASQWTTTQVLELYRLRWQVELVFKRLKSILDLDQLRAKGPALAQTYLLGKVLAALIIEAMSDEATQRYPTLFSNTQRPVSAWRWTTIGRDFLYQAVRGYVSWRHFLDKLPELARYLCISSRYNRKNQAAAARVLLSRLLGPRALAPPALS